MTDRNRWQLAFALATSLVIAAGSAQAGPPLLCHPVEIGEARSLPWGGTGWAGASPSYDRAGLVDDTLALLVPATPVLVRMETLRRAAIYTFKDERLAGDLLARLVARARDADAKRLDPALPWFDAGYLAACYRQAAMIGEANGGSAEKADVDGWLAKALAARGDDPAMEFALALIGQDRRRPAYEDHLRRAAAGAAEGSLLARNLLAHFGKRGGTLAELRASIGAGR